MKIKGYLNIIGNCLIIGLLIGIVFSTSLKDKLNPMNLFAAKNKIIKRDYLPDQSPIEVHNIKIGDEDFKTNEPYTKEGPDWIKKVSFKVRNQSTKKISYIEVRWDFPDTKPQLGAEVSHRIFYGKAEVNTKNNETVTLGKINSSIDFTPGSDLTVKSADNIADLEKILSITGTSTINKLYIRFGLVLFEDGTRWEPSFGWGKPDPQDASRIIPIEAPPFINQ